MGAIRTQVRRGLPAGLIHRVEDCRCGGCESRSVGLVPCFHSMSVETPSAVLIVMGKAGNPRVDAMLTRPGERHAFSRNLAFLERFLVLYSPDEIAGSLGPATRQRR